ncbi:MAG: AIM24 family protein [Clostridia bacterium]|nr:AIM24 family protein [Clostridia bacterium]
MLKLETLNELTLKVTCQGGGDILYTKAGAFICGECYGAKNYQFEKVLLGPQGNPLQAALGQLTRRFTGENLPLMKVVNRGDNITYYANEAQHVVVYNLRQGETISVESENILAFTSTCRYGVRFLAQGVISQKGLATSTLTGAGPNAQVAVLVDGNPIVLSNVQNRATLEVDPDSVVCWIGGDPGFKMDLSWKNLIGQASGESYMFEWGGNNPATVIIQPLERQSGVNIGMDGGSSGQRAHAQQNQTLGGAAQSVQGTLGQLGNMLGGVTGGGMPGAGGGTGGLGGLGGLGGMLGL